MSVLSASASWSAAVSKRAGSSKKTKFSRRSASGTAPSSVRRQDDRRKPLVERRPMRHLFERHLGSHRVGRQNRHISVSAPNQRLDALPPILKGINLGGLADNPDSYGAFDLNALKRMLLAGISPPEIWRHRVQILDMGRTSLKDIGPVLALRELRALSLWRTQVTNIRGIANLSKIVSINVAGTEIADLGSLGDLANIEYLDISETKIEDIRPLSRLAHLKSLRMSRTAIR